MVNMKWDYNNEKQKDTTEEYRKGWKEVFGTVEKYQGREGLDTAELNEWYLTNNAFLKGLVHPSDVVPSSLYVIGIANSEGNDYHGRRITSRAIVSIDPENGTITTGDAHYTLGNIADHFSEYLERIGFELVDYAEKLKG